MLPVQDGDGGQQAQHRQDLALAGGGPRGDARSAHSAGCYPGAGAAPASHARRGADIRAPLPVAAPSPFTPL
ncbi:hypothetical protein San01_41620 [Streptomyces angustmyceticus]|uniref:Uncharacterized protein n=1 Tax=Streptomyces angustmyceticus TaxID=285578 RepID=A0A5J4LMX8_9ACTN|nr:hypothetical protein San01_41620 [Streptomyces angustmyceticus]